MTLRIIRVPTDLFPTAELAFVPAAALDLHHAVTETVVQVTAAATVPVSGGVVRTDVSATGGEAYELVPVGDSEVEASEHPSSDKRVGSRRPTSLGDHRPLTAFRSHALSSDHSMRARL